MINKKSREKDSLFPRLKIKEGRGQKVIKVGPGLADSRPSTNLIENITQA
jgi:hypothetical protein